MSKALISNKRHIARVQKPEHTTRGEMVPLAGFFGTKCYCNGCGEILTNVQLDRHKCKRAIHETKAKRIATRNRIIRA